MAKKKYYAVKRGRKEGVYETWQECREQVEGFSGAVYKGFATFEEAQCFLTGDSQNAADGTGQRCAKKEETAVESGKRLAAYVDGSYDPNTERYSYGCIMITPSGEEICKSGSNDNPETKALRNVAGEMLGAMTATQWAIDHNYELMDLYYDYEGIERWATHDWNAKNAWTKKYADFMDDSAKIMQIRFHKVAAHTGVKYNEKADQLAKKALS